MADDRELMAMLKAGNVVALEQLIERWRGKAEAYACSMLHDPQAAEDAVQEAFSRVYAVRADLDERYSFSAYLFTIVKRICIDEVRKRKRFPDLPGELPEIPVESAEAEYIAKLERLERINLLGGLEEIEKKLLLTFSLDGKSTKEIAREMHMTDGQIRVRLHRIRKRLRKEWKNHEW